MYAAGSSFWGMNVPIMDVAAKDKSTTTVSFIDEKKFQMLLYRSFELASVFIINPFKKIIDNLYQNI